MPRFTWGSGAAAGFRVRPWWVLCVALGVSVAPGDLGAQSSADAGAVTLHWQPASPVVALRMSLVADDPPGLAGTGHLVQHLVLPGLEARVAQVGGRVQVERTSDAVVYTAVGPTSELVFLANALRGALTPPTPSDLDWALTLRTLREERLAEWETAASHVRSALRVRLFPMDRSATGTDASVARLTPRTVSDAWAEMYDPRHISVVGVGDVRIEELRAAFADLPPLSRPSGGMSRDTLSGSPLAPAQATRGWLGIGYPAGRIAPASMLVAARLLERTASSRLPEGATVTVEPWWTHHGRALAIIVAVPGAQLGVASRSLPGTLSALENRIDAAAVGDAAEAVRRDLLFHARTADRMAELIGSFIERGHDADAADQLFTDLADVSLANVRAAIDALSAGDAVRIEIPPQRLGGS